MELDRQYARRRITWKITDVKRLVTQKQSVESPEFTIWLGNNRTSWTFVAKNFNVDGESYFMCVFELQSAQRCDFTIFQEISLAKPNYTWPALERFNFGRHKTDARDFVGFRQALFNIFWPDDNFPMILDTITVEAEVELIEKSKYREPNVSQLTENYEALINNREWADYCLSCCDDKKIYVQKSIVAAHCVALAELIKVRPMIAEFRDINSTTMMELIRFIYCRKIDNLENIASKLLVVAHKYEVDNLKEICVNALMGSITVDNVLLILDTADRLNEYVLKENCIDFIKCKYSRFNTDWMQLKPEILQELWKSTIEKPTRFMFTNDVIHEVEV